MRLLQICKNNQKLKKRIVLVRKKERRISRIFSLIAHWLSIKTSWLLSNRSLNFANLFNRRDKWLLILIIVLILPGKYKTRLLKQEEGEEFVNLQKRLVKEQSLINLALWRLIRDNKGLVEVKEWRLLIQTILTLFITVVFAYCNKTLENLRLMCCLFLF